MYRIADWGQRKQEIRIAFRQAGALPAKTDDGFYADLMQKMDIGTIQDLAIMYSVVEDAIMMARREGRPTSPLEAFKDWLQMVRRG